MANVFPIGQKATINTGNNGNTLILSLPDYEEMGGFAVQFLDAGETGGAAFSGSIQVVARAGSKQAFDDGVTFHPHPHRPSYLNGAVLPAGNIYVHTYAQITGTTNTLIPASGMSIALLVTCASGSGFLYVTPVTGESAVG